MKDIIGSFVIRNEGDGCLTSKYLEHTSAVPYTECCIRVTDTSSETSFPNDPFVGDFTSTWLEPDERSAMLAITRIGNCYELNWTSTSVPTIRYKGWAMLFEQKLVGCYWDV